MELKVICKRLITQNLDENITEGEYGADIVGITVPRMYGEHDLSAFSFRLTAISKLNESVAEQTLTIDRTDDENIHLVWEVTSEFTASSGDITLILAGVNEENTVQIKFVSQPVTINDDYRLEFLESPTILEQAYNQVQLEVQKAMNAAERAEEAAEHAVNTSVATQNEIGGILSGGDISVDGNGSVTINSVNGKTIGTSIPEDAVFTDTIYALPTASAETLGGVKIDNSTIIIDSDGVISSTGSSAENGKTLSGDSSYSIAQAVDYPLLSLTLYGNSTQNGTPSLENPVDIVSIGDNGEINITLDDGSNTTLSAKITNNLPLCSIDNKRDELIFNADGTGKIIKRFKGFKVNTDTTVGYPRQHTVCEEARISLGNNMSGEPNSKVLCSVLPYANNTDDYPHCYVSGAYIYVYVPFSELETPDLAGVKAWLVANNATFVYEFQTMFGLFPPKEYELTADEIAELSNLHTFNGITNISNDAGAEMVVKVATNSLLSEYVKPIIEGMKTRIEALEAAAALTESNV